MFWAHTKTRASDTSIAGAFTAKSASKCGAKSSFVKAPPQVGNSRLAKGAIPLEAVALAERGCALLQRGDIGSQKMQLRHNCSFVDSPRSYVVFSTDLAHYHGKDVRANINKLSKKIHCRF
jgi:hypothetical protein